MIPTDKLEEVIAQLIPMCKIWDKYDEDSMFKTVKEEKQWRERKKSLLSSFKALIEELKDAD